MNFQDNKELLEAHAAGTMGAWPREPDAPLWRYIKTLTDGGTLPKLSRVEVQPLLAVLKERMGAFALFASKLTELVDTVLDTGGAKALYTLVNNRNQMRARRRKHAHPAAEQEYSEWKVDAKRLLAQVQEGTLSYEEFAREIE